jgi:hypothetical protein
LLAAGEFEDFRVEEFKPLRMGEEDGTEGFGTCEEGGEDGSVGWREF